MATASPSDSNLECPICHEDFDDPKILPCTHLACKKCVLSWLSKRGSDGGCPLCRAPILSTRPPQGQLATLVDALPTNYLVMALVENQKVLSSPHVCNMCNQAAATVFCMQCDLKLCGSCVKNHNVIPSTKNHKLKELNNLTAQQLAETNRIMCKAHPDRLGELYCPAHKEVICILCLSTNHESCTGKKSIDDAADEERVEFQHRACALRQSGATIAQQIKVVQDAYKVLRKRVKDTFDDIKKTTQTRKQQLEREIQAQEDAAMTAIKSKDTTLASNANTLEQLVSTAPQAALLAMVADLTSRLDQLQSHTATTTAGQLQVPEFTVDDSTLRQLKSDISLLGQITMTPQGSTRTTTTPAQSTSAQTAPKPRAKRARLSTSSSESSTEDNKRWSPSVTRRMTRLSMSHTESPLSTSSTITSSSQAASSQPTSSQTGPKPRRAELARILKVGDQVKFVPTWNIGWGLTPDHQGRVSAVPSRRKATRGWDPSGWVDVRWDGENVDRWHQMGDDGVYELDLV